jgi:hypothetical protein
MEEKHYYTTEDIQTLYGVGINKARQIVHEIKLMQGGELALGRGKVLARELNAWERAGEVKNG